MTTDRTLTETPTRTRDALTRRAANRRRDANAVMHAVASATGTAPSGYHGQVYRAAEATRLEAETAYHRLVRAKDLTDAQLRLVDDLLGSPTRRLVPHPTKDRYAVDDRGSDPRDLVYTVTRDDVRALEDANLVGQTYGAGYEGVMWPTVHATAYVEARAVALGWPA